MLSYEECRIIARNKCADMFGWDFVDEHKPEFCSQTYVDKENNLMEYTLLWSPFEDKAKNEEARIVIEEMSVVCQVGEVQLHSIGDPSTLHRVHLVQIACGDEAHLEGPVDIEIWEQIVRVPVSLLRMPYGIDQGCGDLLVSGRLEKDPNT